MQKQIISHKNEANNEANKCEKQINNDADELPSITKNILKTISNNSVSNVHVCDTDVSSDKSRQNVIKKQDNINRPLTSNSEAT